MPTFLRTFKPREVGKFTYPAPLMSFGHSGKGQFRATAQRGRTWEERWSALDVSQQDVSDFLALCERYWQSGQIFDIDYYFWMTRPFGTGGGAPLVQGASQTGAVLNVNGGPNNTTAWLKAGDITKIAGLNIVIDVTAQVNTDAFAPLLNGALAAAATSMNIDGTVPGIVEAGETFTIAGESGSPTHTVTGGPYLESPAGQVNGIVFTPGIAAGGVADNSAVNFAASGKAKIPIFPSILTGQSPADNAAVTISGVTYRAAIIEMPSAEGISPAKHLLGFRLVFREMP